MKLIKTIIVSTLVFCTGIAYAKKVDINIVKQVAENTFSQKIAPKLGLAQRGVLKELISETINEDTLLYIANFENSFVIVSGDDATIPVLGYSISNQFNKDSINPSLQYLINGYKRGIKKVKELKINPTQEIKSKWENVTNESSLKSVTVEIVSPLCPAEWGQGDFFNHAIHYNKFTPGAGPAGCVAVAMAQIMHYWGCLVEGTNDECCYVHDYFGELCVDTENTDYHWTDMDVNDPDDYNALLIYHCGVSAKMDYNSDYAGATLQNAKNGLVLDFGFKSAAVLRAKNSYTTSAWIDSLKTNLDNGLPILYGGEDDEETFRHAWVIDGYDSEDRFSCNWGYEGKENGYFSLGDLTPEINYGDEWDFTNDQKAILNIEPLRTWDDFIPVLKDQTFTYNPNGYNLTIQPVEGATSYEWITNHGTFAGNGTTAVLYTDCSATVQVQAYIGKCKIHSSYGYGFITIHYGSIQGSDVVCSNGASFTLSNIPAGTTITWNDGNYISRISPQGSNPCTFASTGSGNSWIEATITTDCGQVTLPQKIVWAGPPSASQFDIRNVDFYGTNYLYEGMTNQLIANDYAYQNITEWEWDYGGWYHWEATSTKYISFVDVPTFNYRDISVRAKNQCPGASNWYTESFYPYGGYFLVFSPNPSTGETVLSIESASTEKAFDETTEWELEVYSETQLLKEKRTKLKGKNTTIQTAGWQDGIYMVRVKYKEEVLTGKLMVKKM